MAKIFNEFFSAITGTGTTGTINAADIGNPDAHDLVLCWVLSRAATNSAFTPTFTATGITLVTAKMSQVTVTTSVYYTVSLFAWVGKTDPAFTTATITCNSPIGQAAYVFDSFESEEASVDISKTIELPPWACGGSATTWGGSPLVGTNTITCNPTTATANTEVAAAMIFDWMLTLAGTGTNNTTCTLTSGGGTFGGSAFIPGYNLGDGDLSMGDHWYSETGTNGLTAVVTSGDSGSNGSKGVTTVYRAYDFQLPAAPANVDGWGWHG